VGYLLMNVYTVIKLCFDAIIEIIITKFQDLHSKKRKHNQIKYLDSGFRMELYDQFFVKIISRRVVTSLFLARPILRVYRSNTA
jgi:hypothetical protein